MLDYRSVPAMWVNKPFAEALTSTILSLEATTLKRVVPSIASIGDQSAKWDPHSQIAAVREAEFVVSEAVPNNTNQQSPWASEQRNLR